jgi:twitching motility two-component system response regulator PilG
MYGNLQEIDLGSILKIIEVSQKTGVLTIETLSLLGKKSNVYFIFCCLGRIVYIGNDSEDCQNLVRLQDYLRYYKVEENLCSLVTPSILGSQIAEYETILFLLEKQIISPFQLKKTLQNLIEESLFDLLSLSQGSFTWRENFSLQPQLISHKIRLLLYKINRQLQLWKQYYPYITDSSQCPIIEDQTKLSTALNKDVYSSLSRWMDGKTSLKQLARYLNRDLVTIGKAIYPCVEKGWLTLLDSSNNSDTNSQPSQNIKELICICKNSTIIEQLEQIKMKFNCQYFIFDSAEQMLGKILEIKPIFIIYDGDYLSTKDADVFRMLRANPNLANIPIFIFINNNQNSLNLFLNFRVPNVQYFPESLSSQDLLSLVKPYFDQ